MDVIDELSWEVIYLCTWTSQMNVRKAIHDEGYYQLMIAHEKHRHNANPFRHSTRRQVRVYVWQRSKLVLRQEANRLRLKKNCKT